MNILIAPELKSKCPELLLGIIRAPVKVSTDYPELKNEIKTRIEEIAQSTPREAVSSIPSIADSRKAYKACGKDPSRYRLSAEALLRRVTGGKALYQINNVVDIINLTSLCTGYSIGGYDPFKIQGDISFGIGQREEAYQALGRGALNIEYLPVFRDNQGAFGSPTSDSPRTCITDDSKELLMVIIDFGGKKDALNQAMDLASSLLANFGGANKSPTLSIVQKQ